MKPRLLIVDDHPVVARGVAALLAPLFTTNTSCAQSGSEALKFVSSALHSQPYTLAIIDLELPKTSGITVTIRNQPSCSNSSRFRTLQAKKPCLI